MNINNPLYHILVAFGASLGDPADTLQRALTLVSQWADDIRCSPLYVTEPHYDKPGAVPPKTPDPKYINAVFSAATLFDPSDVLHRLLEIENTLGRVRTENPCAPRTIDLDLLLVDDLVINIPELVVPHPRMHLRNFVLIPACDIAPLWLHPVLDEPLAKLCAECRDALDIRKL